MKNTKRIVTLLALLVSSSLNATLVIEDFDNHLDTGALQKTVFSFGSAAQAGKPSLAEGLGLGGSNAACFNLTWSTGNNANLSLIKLPQNARNLRGYSEIHVSVLIENQTPSGNSVDTKSSLKVKLAIEGGSDGSIWQTRTVKAERPTLDAFYELRFDLSKSDMERVEGTSMLQDVISDIETIRIRFENAQQPGLIQDAYIDSIVAIK